MEIPNERLIEYLELSELFDEDGAKNFYKNSIRHEYVKEYLEAVHNLRCYEILKLIEVGVYPELLKLYKASLDYISIEMVIYLYENCIYPGAIIEYIKVNHCLNGWQIFELVNKGITAADLKEFQDSSFKAPSDSDLRLCFDMVVRRV